MLDEPSEETNAVTGAIVDAAFEVRRTLGLGLREAHYQEALARELRDRGLRVDEQVPFEVVFKGHPLRSRLRLDMLVEGQVVVEVKAVEALHEAHEAQVITYLRATGRRVGLLINFNDPYFRRGVRRLVQTEP